MKRELLHTHFVLLLQKREPDKSKLIELLMDILCIEKDSAYRRLRGEVPFSFAEAITIGERLGISLDGLMGALYEKTKNFALQQSDF
ncbi:MAG: hypothetical protein LUG98_09105, partial [Tannerellaceae bacterium]|nr:hypothetical protein [Tannerellaceae bacterium]